ncbi:uncharacterized protein YbjQ (UPF0145 family) [Cohnella lubricantis]|nr:uncharacterized protein YbjQ (UPF0145 family) [Cohnella lubricantis]
MRTKLKATFGYPLDREAYRMLVTTTNNVEGYRITQYYGIVNGETIMGANIFRDFLASITDVVGGRSGSYENKLKEAREIAIGEMTQQAQRIGANAIVGVDVDYEVVREGMLMVAVSGTAVRVE